ncbi:putative leucine-rich repeat domain superfamily [Plasmopara halstedii]
MRRAAAWVAALAYGEVESITQCNTSAGTVSNYTMLSTIAAVEIEYANCSTEIVRGFETGDGMTQLDLSNKDIVYVQSLPSVIHVNLTNNNISQLENVVLPTTVQTVDLSENTFTAFQNFSFPKNLSKLNVSNGKLTSLYKFTFSDTITTLTMLRNPIAFISGVVFPRSLKMLSITSTVKLTEFEVRQTDAILFESLETFNVSKTTSLVCSDSEALFRYVQDTLLCVLPDNVFDAKFGIKGDCNTSDLNRIPPSSSVPELMEADSPRRSNFLLFAAISLSIACAGLMSTLAPRTLYERYRKKKNKNILNRKSQIKQQQQQVQSLSTNQTQDQGVAYWDL